MAMGSKKFPTPKSGNLSWLSNLEYLKAQQAQLEEVQEQLYKNLQQSSSIGQFLSAPGRSGRPAGSSPIHTTSKPGPVTEGKTWTEITIKVRVFQNSEDKDKGKPWAPPTHDEVALNLETLLHFKELEDWWKGITTTTPRGCVKGKVKGSSPFEWLLPFFILAMST